MLVRRVKRSGGGVPVSAGRAPGNLVGKHAIVRRFEQNTVTQNPPLLMAADPTEPEVPPDAVGRRVGCGADRATVRYVGPVPPTTGLWLGVEWDDLDRGKHDGSHEGVRYFTCRSPKGGSFVRPAKASFGSDFLTALQQTYQQDEPSDEENIEENIEFHLKMRSELTTVLLNRSEVNGAGEDGCIRQAMPHVRWLDLFRTLLCCWEDVAAIGQQLEELEVLRLGHNRLRLPSDPSAHAQAFSSLKVLDLTDCALTWPQVLHCAPMWPQLEELCVSNNNITELQRPAAVLQTLKKLALHGNPLVQDTLLSIAALPRLEELDVSSCGLTAVKFGDAPAGSQTEMFAALKVLNIRDNNITEWCVVDELAKLPSLVQLSCQSNQLRSSDGNPATAEQMIIAKLGQMVILNGCTINAKVRRGAELDYIKMFGEEWLKAGGPSQTSDEFSGRHPRYLSLIAQYGAPEEGELKKAEPFALKNQLLNITFVFPDHAERKPIVKKLPASMIVQKLKGLLYRLLKVSVADLRLSYVSAKVSGTEFELSSDLKTLQFYSIEDGDQVLVRWS